MLTPFNSHTHSTNVPREACKQHNKIWMTPKRAALCVVTIPLEHYFETGPGANKSLPQISCPVPCEEELTTHARQHLLSKPVPPGNSLSHVRARLTLLSGKWDLTLLLPMVQGLWLKELSVFGNQTSPFFSSINPKREDMHRQYRIASLFSHPWQKENKQYASPRAKRKTWISPRNVC